MPFWFPAIAAGAALALAGKAIARHLNGQLAQSATADPEGIRTVARFEIADERPLLAALAADLTGVIAGPLAVARDAIRTPAGIDIVRLARCGDRWSLTLTRAFSGPQLDAGALEVLGHLHQALARARVNELAWFQRQDRDHAHPHRHPFY
jgi:hypothetical protein